MSSIEIPAQLDECPICASTYENIGHPLKPGVVMMRTCKCKLTIQQIEGGTITIISPPDSEESK